MGVVTLEDVVEELIGEAIVDETDYQEHEETDGLAQTGPDAMDKMMSLAYASIKWKSYANADVPSKAPAFAAYQAAHNAANKSGVKPMTQSAATAAEAATPVKPALRHNSFSMADLGATRIASPDGTNAFATDRRRLKRLHKASKHALLSSDGMQNVDVASTTQRTAQDKKDT